jgi:hypothetical protein
MKNTDTRAKIYGETPKYTDTRLKIRTHAKIYGQTLKYTDTR